MKKIIDNLFTIGFALFAVGLILYWMYFFNGDYDYTVVKSTDDLVAVNGKFRDFEFRGRIESRDYEYHTRFRIDKNKFSYRIARDAESEFRMKEFIKKVKKGDVIQLLIPKTELNKPNHNGDIRIFGIKVDKITFLNEQQSIAEVKLGRTVVTWMIGLMIIVGFILLVTGRILKMRIKRQKITRN
jgi:hypothetical protein